MATNFNSRLYSYAYPASRAPSALKTNPAFRPTTPCEPPPCADCGKLECFCRPRFFAGQLLTEKDLNRLDQYIRGKNRLHALQLHGAGVVNGLIVSCDPCGKGVTVGKGYAISPCGDDIVVCEDVAVDVCALVKKCQPIDPSCQPFRGTLGVGCEDIIEDWILSIRYAESPARGIAALRMGPSCSCGASSGSCACGGTTKSGGCGCGAKSSATCGCKGSSASSNGGCGSTTQKPRVTPAECEPTAICEGYSFDVAPAPTSTAVLGNGGRTGNVAGDALGARSLRGPLWQKFYCCFQPLIDSIPALPDAKPDADAFKKHPELWHLWCCQAKAVFSGYFSGGSTHACTLAARIAALICPVADPKTDPGLDNFAKEMTRMMNIFGRLIIEAMRDCMCNALLPPAPWGTNDDRIPLAIVRVRKKDCMVVDVCNWTQLRPIVFTFPTLEYWLSMFPWLTSLRDIVHRFCCDGAARYAASGSTTPGTLYTPTSAATDAFATPYDDSTLELNPSLSTEAKAADAIFGDMVADAIARGTTPLDPNDVVGSLLGIDLGGKSPLSDDEVANVPQFVALNELLRPVVSDIVAGLKPTRSVATGGGDVKGPVVTESLDARVAALEAAVAKLTGP